LLFELPDPDLRVAELLVGGSGRHLTLGRVGIANELHCLANPCTGRIHSSVRRLLLFRRRWLFGIPRERLREGEEHARCDSRGDHALRWTEHADTEWCTAHALPRGRLRPRSDWTGAGGRHGRAVTGLCDTTPGKTSRGASRADEPSDLPGWKTKHGGYRGPPARHASCTGPAPCNGGSSPTTRPPTCASHPPPCPPPPDRPGPSPPPTPAPP